MVESKTSKQKWRVLLPRGKVGPGNQTHKHASLFAKDDARKIAHRIRMRLPVLGKLIKK